MLNSGLRRNDKGELRPPSIPSLEGGEKDVTGFPRHAQAQPGCAANKDSALI
jgi:hypothetical protein